MIVENGRLVIPLYHGTAANFVPSIKRYGLGGADPLLKCKAKEFLFTILNKCEPILKELPEWDSVSFVGVWISEQKIVSDSGNFQHGQTYLTPSKASAESYALSNPLGSEFLSFSKRIYDLIIKKCPDILQQLNLTTHPILQFFKSNSSPVLITVNNIPVASLLSEAGTNPNDTIAKIEQMAEFLPLEGHVLNLNFRLRLPIDAANLLITAIGPNTKNHFTW